MDYIEPTPTEKGRSYVFDEKTNSFKEGKAAPRLLPDHMRGLPENFTTKDPSDPDRIHELDAPHIVANLTEEQIKAQVESTKSESGSDATFEAHPLLAKDDTKHPVDQFNVDVLKFKVIWQLIQTQLRHLEHKVIKEPSFKLYHLWFPKNRLNPRELRRGRPPIRMDRPSHLKDIDLLIDIKIWPPRIVDMLKKHGIQQPDFDQMWQAAKTEQKLVLL